jgi:hypothetical protein
MNVCYIPNKIANIFSMHKLEKCYRITYDSWEGYCVVHTPRGKVEFHKDKQGLPYIDLDGSAQEAAAMLMQMGARQHVASLKMELDGKIMTLDLQLQMH